MLVNKVYAACLCVKHFGFDYLAFRAFISLNKYRSWIGLTSCEGHLMCWEKGCSSISYEQWEENQFPGKYPGQPFFINPNFTMEMIKMTPPVRKSMKFAATIYII